MVELARLDKPRIQALDTTICCEVYEGAQDLCCIAFTPAILR